MQPHVVVIGGGVIGLQIAQALLESGYSVDLVARHLPGDLSIDYTSPWAGAHWRPHGTADDPEQCEWDMQSYQKWMSTYKQESKDAVDENQRSGIVPVTSRLMWDVGEHSELGPPQSPWNLWFAKEVDDFKIIPSRTGNINSALFTTLAVNVPHYLAYLLRRIRRLGGIIHRATLPTDTGFDTALETASQGLDNAKSRRRPSSSATEYVNATGLAARRLCNDRAVHPARGQTVVVRGEAKGCSTRQGKDYIAYCIPRPGSGTTILGGTKEVGVWDGAENKDVTKTILERARKLCPELLLEVEQGKRGEFEVLGVNIGLRPMRTGGARMEKEILPSGRVVYHAYGHGGAGFQNSVGVAAQILEMIKRDQPCGIDPRGSKM